MVDDLAAEHFAAESGPPVVEVGPAAPGLHTAQFPLAGHYSGLHRMSVDPAVAVLENALDPSGHVDDDVPVPVSAVLHTMHWARREDFVAGCKTLRRPYCSLRHGSNFDFAAGVRIAASLLALALHAPPLPVLDGIHMQVQEPHFAEQLDFRGLRSSAFVAWQLKVVDFLDDYDLRARFRLHNRGARVMGQHPYDRLLALANVHSDDRNHEDLC